MRSARAVGPRRRWGGAHRCAWVAGLGCVLLAATACASGGRAPVDDRGASGLLGGGATPDEAVDRFLAAVRVTDHAAMLALFGTAAGPVDASDPAEGWQERVTLIARLLRHDAYLTRSRAAIAGSAGASWRVGVDLRAGRRHHDDVGFRVVRSEEGAWLIERVELENLMRAPEPVP